MYRLIALGMLCLMVAACGEGGETSGKIEILLSAADTVTAVGDGWSATAVITGGQSEAPTEVSWSSSDPNVATVDGRGQHADIVAAGKGTATITATAGALLGTVKVHVQLAAASIAFVNPPATVGPGDDAQLRVPSELIFHLARRRTSRGR